MFYLVHVRSIPGAFIPSHTSIEGIISPPFSCCAILFIPQLASFILVLCCHRYFSYSRFAFIVFELIFYVISFLLQICFQRFAFIVYINQYLCLFINVNVRFTFIVFESICNVISFQLTLDCFHCVFSAELFVITLGTNICREA